MVYNEITLIIPAYNAEKYISQTLDSMINQTDRQYHVIIVNDGSTDNTLSICEKYANDYPELFTVISQGNKGLGAARNAGLSNVVTPYVGFLDSDDWIDIHYFEKVYNMLGSIEYEPDMIFTLPCCFDSASRRVTSWMDEELHHKIFDLQQKNGNEPVNAISHPELYSLEVSANRKIYRTEFLRRIGFSFPEGIKWEDILPNIQLLHNAKTCVGISDTGFIYRINQTNQITSGTGAGRLDMIIVVRSIFEYIGQEYFSKKELSYIFMLISNYVCWTIDMTNAQYIGALLDGFYDLFKDFPEDYISIVKNATDIDDVKRNRFIGLVDCFKNRRYYRLIDPDERAGLFYYWGKVGPSKNNLISSGIQCLKDSGFRYTFRLAMKKIFKR